VPELGFPGLKPGMAAVMSGDGETKKPLFDYEILLGFCALQKGKFISLMQRATG
jgi:hypothetical protein